jgi:hypothetical protein
MTERIHTFRWTPNHGAVINGKPTQLAGAHTWKPSTGFLDKMEAHGHNFTVLWAFWSTYALDPRRDGYLAWLDKKIDQCLDRGILPVVMLFNYHTGDGSPKFDPRKVEWRRHIDKVVHTVNGRPVVYEIMREIPNKEYLPDLLSWQKTAINYLKGRDDYNRVINVNTGSGKRRVSPDDLWDSGASSISYIARPKDMAVWAKFLDKDGVNDPWE